MPSARAVEIRGAGGVDVLTLRNIEVRDPGPGEVLVAVAACGLNRADTLQRRGLYPAPPGAPGNLAGLEYAGTVAVLGPGVTSAKVGDRVMGIVGGGGMSTYLVVHERELVRVPASMSLEHAAAIPEVFFTAYDALILQGRLAIGHTVLVHAAASGVGTAALQLVAAAGGRSIGTSRNQAKLDRLGEYGLHHGILTDDGKFASQVLERTGGQGVPIILDTVGASYLEQNFEALAMRGAIIVVGLLGGVAGTVPLGVLARKRARLIGTVLRSRPLEEKAALAQDISRKVVPLFETGVLRPVIGDVMPMTDIAAAHARMERNETFGKIVLAW